MEDIGYYFTNWNTDVISIGVVINVVLLLSGYFWGKLFQKFSNVGNTSISLGGTSLIIIVGVALETFKQIESVVDQKEYKGRF